MTGIGVLAFCFGYWAVWMHVLPRIRGYKIYEEVTQLDNGELSKTFVNVYHDERGDVFREKLRRDAIAAAAADSHSSEEKISEVPPTGSHA